MDWKRGGQLAMRTMSALEDSPFVLEYMGVRPAFNGPARSSGFGSAVLGRVTLGNDAILGPFAVLRGDGHVVEVGDNLYLGLHSTVHIAHELYSAKLGARVTIGSNSVVHACTVGDDCVIEENVAVLDGAIVGRGCAVAAGSVVFPRSVLPPGQWCEGSPAVPMRPLASVELHELHKRVRADGLIGSSKAIERVANSVAISGGDHGYVAATVTGSGTLRMGESSSLWFGCVLESGALGVTIASGANVQDNTVLRSEEHLVRVGEGSTIGHNVLLHDCIVGARVLVGMGSTLAPGTVVMDDTFVAAGSCTAPGQVLKSGWLWGGRPARAMSRMNDRMHQVIQVSAEIYREYAAEFAANQEAVLRGADR